MVCKIIDNAFYVSNLAKKTQIPAKFDNTLFATMSIAMSREAASSSVLNLVLGLFSWMQNSMKLGYLAQEAQTNSGIAARPIW